MSECVVRMKMPERCYECEMADGVTCMATGGVYGREVPKMTWIRRRPDWCPIICSIPEGHGRLVDADALVNQWATVPDKLAAGAGENKWVADMVMGIQGHFLEGIIKSLEEAPTIVPAERSET